MPSLRISDDDLSSFWGAAGVIVPPPMLPLRLQRRWRGSPCLTLIVILPRRYNPLPGLKRGPLIPRYRIQRIKGEFATLTTGCRMGRVEAIFGPVVVSIEDGTWDGADATAPGGRCRYVDPDVQRLMTNVDADRAMRVLEQLLAKAEDWARDLKQTALYVEVHGMGLDWHFTVPPRLIEVKEASSRHTNGTLSPRAPAEKESQVT